MSAIPTGYAVAVAAILFGLGFFCLAAHRSAVRILLGVELMLNAALLNFIVFGRDHLDPGGAVFALAVMAGAAAEAAVGLALVFALFSVRRRSDLEIQNELSR